MSLPSHSINFWFCPILLIPPLCREREREKRAQRTTRLWKLRQHTFTSTHSPPLLCAPLPPWRLEGTIHGMCHGTRRGRGCCNHWQTPCKWTGQGRPVHGRYWEGSQRTEQTWRKMCCRASRPAKTHAYCIVATARELAAGQRRWTRKSFVCLGDHHHPTESPPAPVQ
ncbi:hypothetical protein LZ31DRAFT_275515 [Colletotrichum somersetense]|nr:hypothetical protein LZ31DRAFT_275515 [Colletotrichum somersetense]